MGCKAVEMEAYALMYNAKKFMRKATALVTISDNLINHEENIITNSFIPDVLIYGICSGMARNHK